MHMQGAELDWNPPSSLKMQANIIFWRQSKARIMLKNIHV